jgi:hypothetical protein
VSLHFQHPPGLLEPTLAGDELADQNVVTGAPYQLLKSRTVLENRFRGRDAGLDRVDLDGSILESANLRWR